MTASEIERAALSSQTKDEGGYWILTASAWWATYSTILHETLLTIRGLHGSRARKRLLSLMKEGAKKVDAVFSMICFLYINAGCKWTTQDNSLRKNTRECASGSAGGIWFVWDGRSGARVLVHGRLSGVCRRVGGRDMVRSGRALGCSSARAWSSVGRVSPARARARAR
jgi:hypothetical protein